MAVTQQRFYPSKGIDEALQFAQLIAYSRPDVLSAFYVTDEGKDSSWFVELVGNNVHIGYYATAGELYMTRIGNDPLQGENETVLETGTTMELAESAFNWCQQYEPVE